MAKRQQNHIITFGFILNEHILFYSLIENHLIHQVGKHQKKLKRVSEPSTLIFQCIYSFSHRMNFLSFALRSIINRIQCDP